VEGRFGCRPSFCEAATNAVGAARRVPGVSKRDLVSSELVTLDPNLNGSLPWLIASRNCASAFASSSGLMAFSWSLMVSSSYQADRDDDREAKRREDGAQKLSSIMMRPGSSNSRH